MTVMIAETTQDVGRQLQTNSIISPIQLTQTSFQFGSSPLLHAHSAATAVILRHIRQGKELEPIEANMNYNFNYQETIPHYNEIKFLPGDELITECQYSTSNRTKITWGGETVESEMCIAFVYVYPRPKLKFCRSTHIERDSVEWWKQAHEKGYDEEMYHEHWRAQEYGIACDKSEKVVNVSHLLTGNYVEYQQEDICHNIIIT